MPRSSRLQAWHCQRQSWDIRWLLLDRCRARWLRRPPPSSVSTPVSVKPTAPQPTPRRPPLSRTNLHAHLVRCRNQILDLLLLWSAPGVVAEPCRLDCAAACCGIVTKWCRCPARCPSRAPARSCGYTGSVSDSGSGSAAGALLLRHSSLSRQATPPRAFSGAPSRGGLPPGQSPAAPPQPRRAPPPAALQPAGCM